MAARFASRLFNTLKTSSRSRKFALVAFSAQYHTTPPMEHAINRGTGGIITGSGGNSTKKINKNMILKYSNVVTSLNTLDSQSSRHSIISSIDRRPVHDSTESVEFEKSLETDEEELAPGSRPLVIMLPWMLANETALEKYRQIYLRRGFDVLTVRTGPIQLAFPETGAQRVAESMIRFLAEAAADYPRMIVHAFSVGIYQFGEVLVKLNEDRKTFPNADELMATFSDRIRGLVFDSALQFKSVPPGMAKALLPKHSPKAQKIVEHSFRTYMKLMEKKSTRHYIHSQDTVHNNPLKTPGLLLVSDKDPFESKEANETLARAWKENGIPVTYKCWTDSPHVGMYRKHPQEYEEEITNFLKSINLKL